MTGIQIFNTVLLALTLGLASSPMCAFKLFAERHPTRRDRWFWPIQAVFCVPFLFVLAGAIMDMAR